MIEFWQFVWLFIAAQLLVGVWLTYRLYPAPSTIDREPRGETQ